MVLVGGIQAVTGREFTLEGGGERIPHWYGLIQVGIGILCFAVMAGLFWWQDHQERKQVEK